MQIFYHIHYQCKKVYFFTRAMARENDGNKRKYLHLGSMKALTKQAEYIVYCPWKMATVEHDPAKISPNKLSLK